ncbi:Zn-ribbon domain-containing OB-fold protein [Gordonia sp. KTR9]|uniref:Zn-ribbon domain-containing OB-fold protein n=1 Tax=Gordonia sp. KTR9 TaxID=337191 RepID=UPI00027DDF48|nr:OB-fold domain-containing protein [Gordonia sp. KTR9]AFR49488.1 putative nucleic-acid-binding protein containing a Zn-ribbon [Gordonia sp. KTR9]
MTPSRDLAADPLAESRVLPPVTEANAAFWTSGLTGTWQLPRCSECRRFIHPGQPRCPYCLTDTLRPEAVTGDGTVFTYTVNRYPWLPGWKVPFVAAVVELDDQTGLRVTANLIDVDPEDVQIGMRVTVTFIHTQDRAVPVFRPL